MPYGTSRIDRRGLVKLAGWGMTGLRPPGRGNVYGQRVADAAQQAGVPQEASTVESGELTRKTQAATAVLSARSARVRYAGGVA